MSDEISDKNNMDLWNSVCKTNPKTTKKITFGQKGTSIDAYSQIERATELFGPFGNKWGIREEKWNIHQITNSIEAVYNVATYSAIFYYPNGEFPIQSDILIVGIGLNDKDRYIADWTKKLATSALTKGLSKLGFNADVFLGKFDDEDYIYKMNCEFNNISPEEREKKPITNDMANDILSLVEDAKTNNISALKSVNRHFKINLTSIPQLNTKQYLWLKFNLEDLIKDLKENEAMGEEFTSQRVMGKNE